MRIKPTKLEVYETKALGILGGSRPPRDLADLRQLPHQLIHQGARLLSDQRRAEREPQANTSTGDRGGQILYTFSDKDRRGAQKRIHTIFSENAEP